MHYGKGGLLFLSFSSLFMFSIEEKMPSSQTISCMHKEIPSLKSWIADYSRQEKFAMIETLAAATSDLFARDGDKNGNIVPCIVEYAFEAQSIVLIPTNLDWKRYVRETVACMFKTMPLGSPLQEEGSRLQRLSIDPAEPVVGEKCLSPSAKQLELLRRAQEQAYSTPSRARRARYSDSRRRRSKQRN